ncbi:Imidazoleglycerol-phosphate dehydratase [Candidatus Hodgkinia cicadicola]|uniref:Imidazoleglycerol-phosphate dehydratase n=1 Tax=Candidatus Hodgkinia cicadicola TaxID=573658 RepID=A0ABX4MI18_9HYPH|nr:Imidazoleglycerol-phosphate dehydratase [Candidatus Hodgkinia cicadicola]
MYNHSIRRTTFGMDMVGSICPTNNNNNTSVIRTRSPFLNHILSQWSAYSKLCLKFYCIGGIIADYHHTFADIGTVLGMLLHNLIRKNNLFRYSTAIVPMDGSLVRCCIDLSGRPGLHWTNNAKRNLFNPTLELIYTLLNSLVWNSNMNIHIDIIKLDSVHHVSEAIFKSFGVCLFRSMNSIQNIRSTKCYPITNWN